MIAAVIIVCAMTAAECNEDTALEVIRLPEKFESMVQCVLQAQAYMANQAMARGQIEGRALIVCQEGSNGRPVI